MSARRLANASRAAKSPPFQTHAPACVRESLRTLCHHDNASSMSEWVYSFHLVIHSAQLGNSCVHAGRVQTSDNIKIHLISENMFTLVGIVWVAGVGFYHMQRIEFHFDAFWCLLVRSCPVLFFLCSLAHPTACSLEYVKHEKRDSLIW